MGKNQRTKGANFERDVAKLIQSYGWQARRGQVFNHEPDIITDMPIHVEAKRQETTKIHEWFAQSKSACGDKIPTVVHKRSRDDILITLRFEDFMKLLRGDADGSGK